MVPALSQPLSVEGTEVRRAAAQAEHADHRKSLDVVVAVAGGRGDDALWKGHRGWKPQG